MAATVPERLNALGSDFGAARAQPFGRGAIEKPVVQFGGGDAALGQLVLAVPMVVDANRGGGEEVGAEAAEEICGTVVRASSKWLRPQTGAASRTRPSLRSFGLSGGSEAAIELRKRSFPPGSARCRRKCWHTDLRLDRKHTLRNTRKAVMDAADIVRKLGSDVTASRTKTERISSVCLTPRRSPAADGVSRRWHNVRAERWKRRVAPSCRHW